MRAWPVNTKSFYCGLKDFWKIHCETPKLEFHFNSWRSLPLLQSDSSTGVLLWILMNGFCKQLFKTSFFTEHHRLAVSAYWKFKTGWTSTTSITEKSISDSRSYRRRSSKKLNTQKVLIKTMKNVSKTFLIPLSNPINMSPFGNLMVQINILLTEFFCQSVCTVISKTLSKNAIFIENSKSIFIFF